MNEKISVAEFIENMDLLQTYYTPFYKKVELINFILDSINGSFDGISIYRICAQAFIENMTNLDLSVKNDENLDGFDQLCRKGLIESFTSLPEYKMFERLFHMRMEDISR